MESKEQPVQFMTSGPENVYKLTHGILSFIYFTYPHTPPSEKMMDSYSFITLHFNNANVPYY